MYRFGAFIAAVGGWVYLGVWGALAALGAQSDAQGAGVAVGAVVAVAVWRQIVVAQRPEAKPLATAA